MKPQRTGSIGLEPMKITEILTPDLVVPNLRGANKAEILRELAGCLAARFPPSKSMFWPVLMERERLSSTAIE
jgi:mannitol/fructose-specific phosphotransferase system IIA component (Ntr-type)